LLLLLQLLPPNPDSAQTNRRPPQQCTAGRPKCALCTTRGTECVYNTIMTDETHFQALKRKYKQLLQQKSVYRQIFKTLQKRPAKEAEEIYKRIRAGADADSVLRHIQGGDVLLQLALVPGMRY
jgi:hypothetical protein